MDQFTYKTILGTITIESNDHAITQIKVNKDTYSNTKETKLIKQAISEINEYLMNNRFEFTVPIEPTGTPFQKEVWKQLRNIPYSETKTYKDVALLVGNPNASRAIGNACNRNPIHIMIPCHRVIGSNGKLTGYKGGLDVKDKLLNIEKNEYDS